MDASGGMVLISAERLRELEALEQKRKAAFDKLQAFQKAHPEEHSKKMLERYHQNKDDINKRRREKYKSKKLAEAEAAAKAAQAVS